MRRALLVIGAAVACGALGYAREDEFECEEAVAHLESCCVEFPSSAVHCEFIEGCSEPDTYPDLSIELAECIQATDCEDLRARDLCARVATDPKKTTACE